MGVRYQRAVDLVELTGILQTTVTGLSIAEIAERFEVSRRTAERMLSALRDRFPDLEPIFRGGRKYWKLPQASRTRPLQLPRTFEALSERIEQLEAEVFETRSRADAADGITEGVLGTSHVGMNVVNSHFEVVWANRALSELLGVPLPEMIGSDARRLIQDRIQHVFADPDRFASSVLATYENKTYIENLECRLLPSADHEERWLEHWSRPITSGRYAGGRVDHYIDVTLRVREDEGGIHPAPGRAVTVRGDRRPPQHALARVGPIPENNQPLLRKYLSTLQEASEAALRASDASPEMLVRLAQVVHSMSQSAGQALDVIGRGEDKPEPLTVPEALETVVALVRGVADEKGIQLHIAAEGTLPSIRADRALAVSTLASATRNSIEALPVGSHIELRAEVMTDPERVRISLHDDGPGIPDSINGLTQAFVPTKTGGLGLGITMRRDATGRPIGICQYYETPVLGPEE